MTKPDPHLASRIHLRAPVLPPLHLPLSPPSRERLAELRALIDAGTIHLPPMPVPDFDAITVTMPPLSGMAQALRKLGDALRDGLARLSGPSAVTVNGPAYVEGQAALYRTRAALDPAYSTPEALHTLISTIMRYPGALSPALHRMSPQNRAYVATSALTGWARYHTLPPRPVLTFGGHAEHHIIRRHDFTVRAGA